MERAMSQILLSKVNEIFVESYALYLKTQHHHWNMRGAQFQALHDLCGNLYQELSEGIDEVAEHIRASGAHVTANFETFHLNSKLPINNSSANIYEMVKDLINCNEIIISLLNESINLSMQEGNNLTADILTDRLRWHAKTAWLLKMNIE